MSIPEPKNARAAVARAYRRGTEADQADARNMLAAANIADAIRREVAKWPDLSDDQRAELALLLTGEAA